MLQRIWHLVLCLDKLMHRCEDDLPTSPLHSGPAAALVWTLGPRMFCSWAGAPLHQHRLAEGGEELVTRTEELRSWATKVEMWRCHTALHWSHIKRSYSDHGMLCSVYYILWIDVQLKWWTCKTSICVSPAAAGARPGAWSPRHMRPLPQQHSITCYSTENIELLHWHLK